MAKEKKDDVILESVAMPALKMPKEVAVPVPAAPVKRFTFEQYAVQRMIKEHHKSGLMAYCKNPNKLRTLEEWDKAFENY